MQLFLDYLPVIAFAGTFWLTKDIYTATAVLMIAMPVMLAGHWLISRKVNRIHVISTVLILVLGATTLYFKSSAFIAWKPTVLNWLLSLGCLATIFIGEKTLIERMLGAQVQLRQSQWRQLTVVWSLFFALLGAVNLYVYFNYAEDTWVYFKLWGLLGLTLVFVLLQGGWLAYMMSENEKQQPPVTEQK